MKLMGIHGYTMLATVVLGIMTSAISFADDEVETFGRHTKQIVAGAEHTCAVANDGQVKCWGFNFYGELGVPGAKVMGRDPMTMGAHLPTVNLGEKFRVKEMCAGTLFNCALNNQGKVKCWGRNERTQLGQGHLNSTVGLSEGDMGEKLPFTNLGDDFVASSLSCGTQHVCALSAEGAGKCWGSNTYGELAVDPTKFRSIGGKPAEMGSGLKVLPFTKPIRKFALGDGSSCALFNDEIICWGNNSRGQIGIESTTRVIPLAQTNGVYAHVKLEEPGTSTFVKLIAGGTSSFCAQYATENNPTIPGAQKVKCWGDNSSGQLGIGMSTSSYGSVAGSMGKNLPEAQLDLSQVVNLEMHGDFACASNASGRLKCWGYNSLGALGLGDKVSRGRSASDMAKNLPAVDLDLPIVRLSSGTSRHSCAILVNHEVKCWGVGSTGALGYENTENVGTKLDDMGVNLPFVNIW